MICKTALTRTTSTVPYTSTSSTTCTHKMLRTHVFLSYDTLYFSLLLVSLISNYLVRRYVLGGVYTEIITNNLVSLKKLKLASLKQL